MTEREIKKLARRLLYDLLADPANADTFGQVFVDMALDDGEPVPVYSGEDKAGGFECYFWPLAGAEEIVRRCEQTFDAFELHDAGGPHRLADLWTEDRAEAIESMARIGIFHLLLNLRDKLTAAFDLNVDECELSAASLLAGVAVDWARQLGLKARADVAPEVKKLSARVASEEKEHLKRLLKGMPLVELVRKPGPKPIEDADIEAALRALGTKAAKATAITVAVRLERERKAVLAWAKATRWGNWPKAKRALLGRIKSPELKNR